jgi:hypothetical protein
MNSFLVRHQVTIVYTTGWLCRGCVISSWCVMPALCPQVISYDGHTSNILGLGFQKDGKWIYSGGLL